MGRCWRVGFPAGSYADMPHVPVRISKFCLVYSDLRSQMNVRAALPTMVQRRCSEPAKACRLMDTTCLLSIVAIVKSDFDEGSATDVQALADQMLAQYPGSDRDELVRVIEQSLIVVNGTAL